MNRVATGRLERPDCVVPAPGHPTRCSRSSGLAVGLPGLINQIQGCRLSLFAPGSETSTGRSRLWASLESGPLGFCTVLLWTGMMKLIRPSTSPRDRRCWLAHGVRQDHHPTLRHEIGVCLPRHGDRRTCRIDIVYVSTAGESGNATASLESAFNPAFTQQRIGLASALAVMLMALTLVVVIPIQRLEPGERNEDVAANLGCRSPLGLMTITILPFISIFMTALHPSGTVPGG